MRKDIQIIISCFSVLFYLTYIFIYLFSDRSVRELIDNDVRCILKMENKNSIIWLVYILKYDPYFKTLFFHRTKTNLLTKLLYHDNKHDFYIPYDVKLGKNIEYSHPYGTILNAKSIGDNFKFKHLTTIGNKNDNEALRPTILNNVTLGANVTIIGDVVIGNNVVIGAGAIITKSIPDNSVVVGQPFRIYNTKENG